MPDRFPEDVRRFVDVERWTYATTMPQWPHEYLVRARVDEALFERTVTHIRSHGYEDRFYSKSIVYFEEDGPVYWTMGAPLNETAIINRVEQKIRLSTGSSIISFPNGASTIDDEQQAATHSATKTNTSPSGGVESPRRE